jgi:lipopolysaccharide export system permease protein
VPPAMQENGVARFDRYILSQMLVLFGFASLVLVLVYWINRAVVLFDQLIADGQSAGVFLELTALSLPNLIRIVLPISAFAASVYVTNRMSSESELTVVQATGFSPFRLARPVLAFGLFVTLLMMILTHILVPASISQMNARQAEIAQNATARLLREGQFLTPAPGVTLYIREITPEGELRDIFLSDTRASGESITYTATRAFIVRSDRGPQLVMIDGLAQTLRHETERLITTSFNDLAYDIGSLIRTRDPGQRSSRELSTRELLNPTPALIAETGHARGRLIIEAHDRFGQAIIATVAALLGFSTLMVGGFSRFGLWRQIVAAVFLVILVKLIETVMVGAVGDNTSRWPLIYLPALIGLGIVGFLLHWSANPYLFRKRPRPGPAMAEAT